MQRKKAGCIIVIGCNAGNIDYLYYNVASSFAYVTENAAPVLASDGTVLINWSGSSFKSKNDDTFKKLYRFGKRSNEGWLLYTYNSSKKNYSYKLSSVGKSATLTAMLKAINKY